MKLKKMKLRTLCEMALGSHTSEVAQAASALRILSADCNLLDYSNVLTPCNALPRQFFDDDEV